MRACDAPRDRAARMNSISRTFSTCARASRAYPAQPVTVKARMTLSNPGPRKAANAMARRIPGKERNELIRTMLTKRSNAPPKYPAREPSARPTTPAPSTTDTPTSNETRAPYRVRDRTSRPSSSVPNQCCAPGGRKRSGRLWAAGSRGASHGAKTAIRTSNTVTARPQQPNPLVLRNCRIGDSCFMNSFRIRVRISPVDILPFALHLLWAASLDAGVLRRLEEIPRRESNELQLASLQPHPRVNDRINDVREQVHHDIGQSDHQNAALQQGVISGGNCLHGEPSNPRPGENRFRDNRAGQQRTKLQTHDRDDGNQCIGEGVPEQHRHLRDAFRASGAHVVARKLLDHRPAHHASQDRRQRRAQRDGRQDQMARAAAPRNRQPSDLH